MAGRIDADAGWMMSGKQRYVTVEVEIDVDDVFENVSDDTLLAEVNARDLTTPHRASVQSAIAQIRRGDHLDAITTLEREFWPKWSSVEDSEAALRKVQAANDNREAAGVSAVAGP